MAKIIPFKAIRPSADKVHLVASRSVSTYSKAEMRDKLETNPYSFLHVLKPDFAGGPSHLNSTDEAYLRQVKAKFEDFLSRQILIQDNSAGYYIYRQHKQGFTYTGIIGCIAITDYFNGVIKRHEDTLTEKEEKLRDYLEIVDINAEPVCFAYQDHPTIQAVLNAEMTKSPAYDFSTTNEIRHQLWVIDDAQQVNTICEAFEQIPAIYIADGHHRSASSCLLGKDKNKQPNNLPNHPSNYFMGIFIPESQLRILDFNRVVRDLNGLNETAFLKRLSETFHVKEVPAIYRPGKMHEFSMYLNKKWYALEIKKVAHLPNDPVSYLDAALLTQLILNPILGIQDIRNDHRIDFVGGHEGMEKLQQLVDSKKMAVAFGLFPVTMDHLKKIADARQVMPPKSTWIEPKLRSGLTIYSLNERQ